MVKTTEPEDDQEKHNEPWNALNKESVTDEHGANVFELQSVENPEELAKEEHQLSGVEQPTSVDDPSPTEVASQDEVSGLNEHPTSTDQPTSRKMEVPSNKVS